MSPENKKGEPENIKFSSSPFLGYSNNIWVRRFFSWLIILGSIITNVYFSRICGPGGFFLGSWLIILGSWLIILGSWLIILGSWLIILGSWLIILGSWLIILGSWLIILGSWLNNHKRLFFPNLRAGRYKLPLHL